MRRAVADYIPFAPDGVRSSSSSLAAARVHSALGKRAALLADFTDVRYAIRVENHAVRAATPAAGALGNPAGSCDDDLRGGGLDDGADLMRSEGHLDNLDADDSSGDGDEVGLDNCDAGSASPLAFPPAKAVVARWKRYGSAAVRASFESGAADGEFARAFAPCGTAGCPVEGCAAAIPIPVLYSVRDDLWPEDFSYVRQQNALRFYMEKCPPTMSRCIRYRPAGAADDTVVRMCARGFRNFTACGKHTIKQVASSTRRLLASTAAPASQPIAHLPAAPPGAPPLPADAGPYVVTSLTPAEAGLVAVRIIALRLVAEHWKRRCSCGRCAAVDAHGDLTTAAWRSLRRCGRLEFSSSGSWSRAGFVCVVARQSEREARQAWLSRHDFFYARILVVAGSQSRRPFDEHSRCGRPFSR